MSKHEIGSAQKQSRQARIAALEARVARLEALLTALFRQPRAAVTVPVAPAKLVRLDRPTPFGPQVGDHNGIDVIGESVVAGGTQKPDVEG